MSEKWVIANMQERLVKRTATSTEILARDADGDLWLIAEFNGNGHYAKAERAVACVNACAGMADPAREIAELRAEVAQLAGLVAGEYVRGREHEQAVRADVENAHIAALREQNAAMRNALIQARGALLLDHMVQDDGEPFGTTVVALNEIDSALATKEPTDV